MPRGFGELLPNVGAHLFGEDEIGDILEDNGFVSVRIKSFGTFAVGARQKRLRLSRAAIVFESRVTACQERQQQLGRRDPEERRSDPVDPTGDDDGLAGGQPVDSGLRDLVGGNPHDPR